MQKSKATKIGQYKSETFTIKRYGSRCSTPTMSWETPFAELTDSNGNDVEWFSEENCWGDSQRGALGAVGAEIVISASKYGYPGDTWNLPRLRMVKVSS